MKSRLVLGKASRPRLPSTTMSSVSGFIGFSPIVSCFSSLFAWDRSKRCFPLFGSNMVSCVTAWRVTARCYICAKGAIHRPPDEKGWQHLRARSTLGGLLHARHAEVLMCKIFISADPALYDTSTRSVRLHGVV